MSSKQPISFATYLFLCFVLFRVLFLVCPWKDNRTISFDPAGYYLSLPAIFIYDDLAHFQFYDTINTRYKIGDWQSHAFPIDDDRKALKYSLGMAILYSPAFFTAHTFAETWGYAADGYSSPYLVAMCFWALIVAFIGLFYLRKVLLRFFDDRTTALCLFLLVFATNYLPYAAINNLMSHGFLFTLYALLLYHSLKWHESPNWWSTLGIALPIGLLALSRPTEIIAVLIPLLLHCKDKSSFKNNLDKFTQHWPKLLLAVLLVGMIGSIQLVYWKVYTGHFLFYSYQDQGFDFLRPHIWDGLFSFRKGWLIYTPLMIFAILGFRPLYQQHRGLFIPFFLFFLLNIYLVFSWSIWWYGGSLGSRPVIQSYAILAFPLAAFIQMIVQHSSRFLKIVMAILALLFIDLNLIMSWQATAPNGPWHAEYMTQKYYQKIIGKTVWSKDYKKFLDISKELTVTKDMQVKTLLYHDFEQDSLGLPKGNTKNVVKSGQYAMKINGQLENDSVICLIDLPVLPNSKKAWIRLSTEMFYKNRVWNEWRLARLRMRFIREGKVVAGPGIRLQWLTKAWRWHHATFEYPIKKAFKGEVLPGDQLQISVENHQSGVPDIFIDDLKVEWIQTK